MAAQSSGQIISRPPIRQLPGPPRVVTTPTPEKPKRKLLNAQEMLHQRRVAKCIADKGRWTIVVRPINMTARGSDVDELYGTIFLVASGSATSYKSTIAHVSEGGAVRRNPTDIWFSPHNADVGRHGGRGLATITIAMRGDTDARGGSNMADSVGITFAVKDEDDGRGGSNDERFVLDQGGVQNTYRIRTPMPSCAEAPNYLREARTTLHARSNGDNRLSLALHVRWFRETGI